MSWLCKLPRKTQTTIEVTKFTRTQKFDREPERWKAKKSLPILPPSTIVFWTNVQYNYTLVYCRHDSIKLISSAYFLQQL